MTVISDTSVLSNFYLIEELEIIRLTFGKILIPNRVNDELMQLQKFGRDITPLMNSEWMEVKEP